jgi:hypothetical protein
MANDALFTTPPDYGAVWRLVPVTALLAAGLAGLEKVVPEFAVGLAGLLLAGVFIFPVGKGGSALDNINRALSGQPAAAAKPAAAPLVGIA